MRPHAFSANRSVPTCRQPKTGIAFFTLDSMVGRYIPSSMVLEGLYIDNVYLPRYLGRQAAIRIPRRDERSCISAVLWASIPLQVFVDAQVPNLVHVHSGRQVRKCVPEPEINKQNTLYGIEVKRPACMLEIGRAHV